MNSTKLFNIDIAKRNYGLDILRMCAVFFVLYVHTKDLLPTFISNIIDIIHFDGVSIFFVLSGFLIGRVLIKLFDIDDLSIKNVFFFWINRWTRTLPLYLFVLFVYVLLNRIFKYNDVPYKVIDYIFFIENFKSIHPGLFISSWSLSVEEWFYVLTPILFFVGCILFRRVERKYLFWIIIVLFIVIIIGFRLVRFYNLTYNKGMNPDSIYFTAWYFRTQVITRLDSIMYGVFGAYIYYYFYSIWIKNTKILFFIGLSLLYLLPILINKSSIINIYLYQNVFAFVFEGIGVLLLLPLLTSIKRGNGYVYKVVTFISIISYSIYLVHLLVKDSVMYVTTRYFTVDYLFCFFIIWIISILVSIVTYKYIEQPGMSLREKIKN